MQNRTTQPHTAPLIIRRNQLKQIVGISPSSVDRLEAAGQFPKRRKIGPGCVGWLYSEVLEFLNKMQQTA